MIRFFATPSDISDDIVRLGAEDAAHIRSLRLRPSELFIVCDGEGTDYVCRLSERSGIGGEINETGCLNSPQQAGSLAVIVEKRRSLGEPTVSCVAYIALMKGDRLDYAVQKSVELGADGIVLFPSERCITVPGDIKKKIARFQRIALETAKQCGRGCVPVVSAADSFEIAVKQAATAGLPLFFYECEEETRLKQALSMGLGAMYQEPGDDDSFPGTGAEDRRFAGATYGRPKKSADVSVMTGPEGGFESFEADFAKASGMISVSLGARILRCETAPAAALAAVMFYTGNL